MTVVAAAVDRIMIVLHLRAGMKIPVPTSPAYVSQVVRSGMFRSGQVFSHSPFTAAPTDRL